MSKELNYEQDSSIDDSALDVEWLRQPELMMKYTQLEAQGQQEYEQAELNYKITRAEMDKKVRDNPDAYNLSKTTETAIQAAVRTTPEYKEAKDRMIDAQYDWNMAKAAVRSMYAKKEALENLVRLHGQLYFAGPSVPRDLNKEWAKKQEEKKKNKRIKIGQPPEKTKRRRRRKK